MKNAAMEANIAAPEFDLHDFFRVTFKRNYQFASLSTATSDRQAIASDRQAIEIDDRITAILRYLNQNGKAKNTDISKLLELSPGRTRTILKELVEQGLIIKHSDKRHAYYTARNAKSTTNAI